MNIYWPALGLIFSFLICTSRTFEGWRMSLEMYVTCRAIRESCFYGFWSRGVEEVPLTSLKIRSEIQTIPPGSQYFFHQLDRSLRVKGLTNPENTDSPSWAEGSSVRLDHTFQSALAAGRILQNIPWSCQARKKTINSYNISFVTVLGSIGTWWEYQNLYISLTFDGWRRDWTDRSKFARRDLSRANQTMVPNANHITHPVIPGPVAKLYLRNPNTPLSIRYLTSMNISLYLFLAIASRI